LPCTGHSKRDEELGGVACATEGLSGVGWPAGGVAAADGAGAGCGGGDEDAVGGDGAAECGASLCGGAASVSRLTDVGGLGAVAAVSIGADGPDDGSITRAPGTASVWPGFSV
jgi:hypothetical protein